MNFTQAFGRCQAPGTNMRLGSFGIVNVERLGLCLPGSDVNRQGAPAVASRTNALKTVNGETIVNLCFLSHLINRLDKIRLHIISHLYWLFCG